LIGVLGHSKDRNMSLTRNAQHDPDRSMVYHIRIKGHLGPHWADWFEGLTITREANGDTLLTGSVVDQAALYGLLRRVRDVGLPLVSVMRVEPDQPDAPTTEPRSVSTTA